MTTPILFYLTPDQMPDIIPSAYNSKWPNFGGGVYAWILQTYLLLQNRGFDCELVCEIQGRNGIIIAHRASLLDTQKPAHNQLFVCVQADWGRHPFSQVHICQNKMQTKSLGQHAGYNLFWPGSTYFIHHWPQPEITARDARRGAELKSIAYFGLDYNLAPELRSNDWTEFLIELGIEWKLIDQTQRWGDYSMIDAVIVIRDFLGTPYYNKPATKVYNAWAANCLPICTPESASLHEVDIGSNSVVYVNSYEELKEQVRHLKGNPDVYAHKLKSVAANQERYTLDVIADEWILVLRDIDNKNFKKYTENAYRRTFFLSVRWISTLALIIARRLKP